MNQTSGYSILSAFLPNSANSTHILTSNLVVEDIENLENDFFPGSIYILADIKLFYHVKIDALPCDNSVSILPVPSFLSGVLLSLT